MEATLTDPRIEFLRTLPKQVFLNLIEDSLNESPKMYGTTFALSVNPLFRKTQTVEMFDLAVSVIREKVVLVTQASQERNKLHDAIVMAARNSK